MGIYHGRADILVVSLTLTRDSIGEVVGCRKTHQVFLMLDFFGAGDARGMLISFSV